ncbi:MAG: hypothetical protein H7318_09230 [Oligoflexus sp.]|nr:hypothetical protein [Oligoflexus sp.]
MISQMLMRYATAITLALSLGCAGDHPQLPNHKNGDPSGEKYSGTNGASDATPDGSHDSDGKGITNNSLLVFKNTTQDAVDYSFGMAAISFQNEIEKGGLL